MCPAASFPPHSVCHIVRPHKGATRSCVEKEGKGVGCLMDISVAPIWGVFARVPICWWDPTTQHWIVFTNKRKMSDWRSYRVTHFPFILAAILLYWNSTYLSMCLCHILCLISPEKIPGLSREGSPHSATSNKVSSERWKERRIALHAIIALLVFLCFGFTWSVTEWTNCLFSLDLK